MLKASPDSIHTENTAGENVIGLSTCRLKIIAVGRAFMGNPAQRVGLPFSYLRFATDF
jgi:hypothetical protein